MMYMEFAKRLAPEALPGWPLGLSEALAAAYLGMSQSLFRKELAAGRLPPPIRVSEGRQVWHRDQLTDWLTSKAGTTYHRPNEKSKLTPKDWD